MAGTGVARRRSACQVSSRSAGVAVGLITAARNQSA
jgi:hypothetical protein